MTARRSPLPLRILLVDDDEGEFLLVKNLLARFPGRAIALDWVTASQEALRTFRDTGAHDVYLIDYKLLDHTGLDVVRDLRASGCRAPLIMLTTCSEDTVDRQAMRAGAADYLIKSEMTRAGLQRAIRHALERAELAKALRESEERYRSLARNFPNGCLLVIDHDGDIVLAEGTCFPVLLGETGPDPEALVGTALRTAFEPALAEVLVHDAGRALAGKASSRELFHHGLIWLVSATPQQRFDAAPQAVLMLKDVSHVRGESAPPSAAVASLIATMQELERSGALPAALQASLALLTASEPIAASPKGPPSGSEAS